MLLLTYGMLTNDGIMHTDAKRLGVAELHGYSWEMLRFANVYESPNDSVLGILWEIDDYILEDLDLREGYPDFYSREEVDVFHQDTWKPSWVYTMTPEYREHYAGSEPSNHYYNSVLEGYATDGIVISAMVED